MKRSLMKNARLGGGGGYRRSTPIPTAGFEPHTTVNGVTSDSEPHRRICLESLLLWRSIDDHSVAVSYSKN